MRLEFDRGTIICEQVPSQIDARKLPGVQWDPRAEAWRAPAYQRAQLRAFLAARDLRFEDRAGPTDRHTGSLVCPELRPYQQAALESWQLAGRRGWVALPTGSGKTRVALAAIATTRVPTLCLVPTRILLEQWCGELSRAFEVPVGCYGDGERRQETVTVATFESAYRHMARIGNAFALLVVDELHHFGTGIREEALEMSSACMRLGLTATPPQGGAATLRLERLVGPLVYQLAIADLRGTFLADFDVLTLTLALSEDERAAYEAEMVRFRPACRWFFRDHPLGSWADFMRACRRTPQGRESLDAWFRSRRLLALTEAKGQALGTLLARHRDSRILVFTSDNETAYRIAREHLIMPLTCDISRKERVEVLQHFRQGTLRALVSARVLNEGLDVPDADVAVIVGGAHGEREHIQRVGRLLRPLPGKRATIYELVAAATSEVGQAQRRRRTLG